MKVFISWSGQRSLAVAKALHDWLPLVNVNFKPFLSSEDTRIGKRWLPEINKKLEQTDFGVCCLDATNQHADWIAFEAGALARKLDEGKVAGYLDGLADEDVKGPLSQFQHSPQDKAGTFKLLGSLNESAGEEGISPERLEKVFEQWWPELEGKLQSLPDEGTATVASRKPDDMIPEILAIVRRMAIGSPLFEPDRSVIVQINELILDEPSNMVDGTFQYHPASLTPWKCLKVTNDAGDNWDWPVEKHRIISFRTPVDAAWQLLRIKGVA